MVAIDNTTLALLLHPKAKPPIDPATNLPLEKCRERIEKLIDDLDADGERVIIPTPVLCEFLILAGKEGPEYLGNIESAKTFLVMPFDKMAAVELAAMELEHRGKGGRKKEPDVPYQKVKFDRQIVVIAKANGAHTIYSDDGDVRKFATRAGLKVVSTWELEVPPSKTPLFDLLEEGSQPVDGVQEAQKKDK
jgi:hypothetical protein